MDNQVKMHAKTLADFEFHARKCQDSEVRNFASRGIPVIREHFQMARQIAGVDAPGRSSRGRRER